MRDVRQTPGLRFVYSDQHPGVCVLVRNNTALTVVTRSLCRPAAQLRRARIGRRDRPERRPYDRACRRQWHVGYEEEAA
jgi:hypothetical protein